MKLSLARNLVVVFVGLIAIHNYESRQIFLRTIADVVSSVQRHFFSKCVFILYSKYESGMKSFRELVQLQKLISKPYVQVSTLKCEAHSETIGYYSETDCNLPLHAVVLSNSSTILQLQECIVSTKTRWLLFLTLSDSLQSVFSEMHIPLDCEFLVAQQFEERVHLTEVYRIDPTFPLQTRTVGSWTDIEGLQWTRESFYRRRSNFHGFVFRAVVHKDSLLTDIIREDDQISYVGGCFGEIWNTLSERMNFITEYKEEKRNWGHVMSNGSWNGMIGRVVRGEADVAVSDFHMSRERLSAVDYLPPLQNNTMALFIRQPDMNGVNWSCYLSPFKWQLWSAMVVTILILTLSLFITSYIGRFYEHEKSRCFTFCDSLLCVLQSICAQDDTVIPSTWPCRIILLTTYLTGVVLLSVYSGTLTSFLAVQSKYILPFNNYEEFLEDGAYTTSVSESALLFAFRNSADYSMQQVYKTKLEPFLDSLPNTTEDGFRQVCVVPKYTLVDTTEYFLALRTKKDLQCDIVDVPGTVTRISISMIILKRSPYLKFLFYNVEEMRKVGILSRFRNMHKKFEYQQQLKKLSDVGVTVNTVLPIIVLLLLGIILSIIFLFIEDITHLLRNN